MSKTRRSRRSADIDITPLIDMMFMLIIFFVLTTSFVNGKLSVELPSGTGLSSSKDGAITVSVAANGMVQWNGKKISASELADLARSSSGRDVLIAGDKGAAYGKIADVLSILRKNGITSAGLLMQGDNAK
jgi:biopolymer transport protein ExbD